MTSLKKVVIVAGGTGGHVFPGIVVAKALQAKNVEVHWLGTPTGIEAERVPAAGIPITFIRVKGLRGMGWRRLLRAPWDILKAIWVSFQLIRQFKPDVVCGMGGFAAGPAGMACLLTGTPLIIEEQNAIAGFTNRILSHWAKKVLLGLPPAPHPHSLIHGTLIGNPLRRELYQTSTPAERFADRQGALRILVLGGSQGALALNQLVPQALKLLNRTTLVGEGIDVWHQTGIKHLNVTEKCYQECGVEVNLAPFIEDMGKAYAWADIVICRSGALTISELAAVGVPALLIPFPAAIDDHQTYNAQYLVERGAARCLPQKSLGASLLAEHLQSLGQNRKNLQDMAEKGRQGAYPQATEYMIKALESIHE